MSPALQLTRPCPFPAVFLCCFPVLSLLGLFPQINTFCTYLLEQTDMLLFGGSGESPCSSGMRPRGPEAGEGRGWKVCLV